jgi:hypothetical protein
MRTGSRRLQVVVLASLLLIVGKVGADDKWYAGGTLHAKKMSEWRTASYASRLATASDFVTKMMQIDGDPIPPVDSLKPKAVALENCISAAGKDGVADSQETATIGATCWIMMK